MLACLTAVCLLPGRTEAGGIATDTLTVKLAKDLKDLNSVTTGKTVQNDGGITITNDANDETKNVVINGDQISFGGNQVKNMGSGSDGTDVDKKPTYNPLTNGANIGDVKNIANSTVQPVIDTVNKGWELDVDGTKRKDVTPTSRVVNLAAGQNIELGGTGDTVTIATADDVRFNTVRVGGRMRMVRKVPTPMTIITSLD